VTLRLKVPDVESSNDVTMTHITTFTMFVTSDAITFNVHWNCETYLRNWTHG